MKVPVITVLVTATIVSMVLLTSLIALNFVVFEKMNGYRDALELFSDPSQSHLSNFLKEKSRKIVEVLDKNRQIVVTSQTIGFLLFLLFGVRLCVFISLLYPPQKESRFSFIRRPFEEMKSLFEIEDFMLDLSGLYANREAENQLEEERLKEAKNQLQAERERDRLQKWRLEAARLDPQDQMQAGPNWTIWKEWSSGKYEDFYEELEENKLREAENQLEEERLKEAKNQLQAERDRYED